MYILREYRDIKAYQEDFSNKKIPLPSPCPACYFKILHRHSIYDRGILIRDKETEKLEDLVVGILVVRCANPDPCPQRHHALLPAFLYPYRRIGPEVTEKTFHSLVTDGTKSTRSFEIEGISRRLVRRWIQWFLNWFTPRRKAGDHSVD